MFSAIVIGFLALSALASPTAEDAPHSPTTIKLVARKASTGSALKRRASSQVIAASGQVNVPLTDFFQGTDLQWIGDISVGTPPQNFTVVYDTGSETLEIPGLACGSPCANQAQFDSSKSSTFIDGGKTSSIEFATGVGVAPVEDPADWKLTLRSATDTVAVGGLKAANVDFFLITNQTVAFESDTFDGIAGMGPQNEGVFAAFVETGLAPLFSMFLTPNAVGHAEMTLGGIDESKLRGPLTYASIPLASGDWEIASTRITVNGKTTSILEANRSIIFDTGTSNVLFPTAVTEAIYALISSDIKANTNEPGTYGIACNKIDTLPAQIDITFLSQSGEPFNLTIPSRELNVGPFDNDPSECQTLINAFDGLNLVGGSLLKHYVSVFDVGNQRMGFASNGF